ncbi:MAG: ATP-dependent DNA helicase RecG [Candidatus Omnitrophota bacterium]
MQEKKEPTSVPVRYIKGVGPKRADLFEKLGIENISDLFYYLPRRYEDRTSIVDIEDLKPGEYQAVIGKVLKVSTFTARTGKLIFQMEVGNSSRRIFAVWYNQPFLRKTFSPDQTVMLYGKVELQKHLQFTHPVFEILDDKDVKESLDVGRIVPFYSLTEDLGQRYVRKTMHNAIRAHAARLRDHLPTYIRARKKMVDAKFAVENIHFPHSFDNLDKAYKRLVFEEFFVLQVIMALRRKKVTKKGIRHEVREGLLEDFKDLFDFELTEEQKKCINEIERDMSSEKTMYRLLQGDVGSGKTVVGMYAVLLTVQNGHQAAVMAPTEILARQHYITISKELMPLGLNIRLLVGGIDKDTREKIKEELKKGEVDVVIGTHALIQEDIAYSDLGLVIIDEQHKFGVDQRKALREKSSKADTLVMTATPIPRSLAMTIYGDMDISMLREKPGGREEVTTYWVGEDRRKAVYSFLRDEIEKGRQAFIVYPRIKKTAGSALLSAEEMFEHLRKDVFPDLRLALIHGRMNPEEKDGIMKDFRDKKYDILIATTVIEVGIDIPNVTVMLVEHAERYGLAQLHQLRGRIGRGRHASYCILMGEPKTDASDERLSTMTETHDGFEIAEKDLDIRGPGEFLGTRQSGLPELRFGNIVHDFTIMEEAREEAFRLVSEDPALKDSRHAGIRDSIKERFKGKLEV